MDCFLEGVLRSSHLGSIEPPLSSWICCQGKFNENFSRPSRRNHYDMTLTRQNHFQSRDFLIFISFSCCLDKEQVEIQNLWWRQRWIHQKRRIKLQYSSSTGSSFIHSIQTDESFSQSAIRKRNISPPDTDRIRQMPSQLSYTS